MLTCLWINVSLPDKWQAKGMCLTQAVTAVHCRKAKYPARQGGVAEWTPSPWLNTIDLLESTNISSGKGSRSIKTGLINIVWATWASSSSNIYDRGGWISFSNHLAKITPCSRLNSRWNTWFVLIFIKGKAWLNCFCFPRVFVSCRLESSLIKWNT